MSDLNYSARLGAASFGDFKSAGFPLPRVPDLTLMERRSHETGQMAIDPRKLKCAF